VVARLFQRLLGLAQLFILHFQLNLVDLQFVDPTLDFLWRQRRQFFRLPTEQSLGAHPQVDQSVCSGFAYIHGWPF
jgi:hypothetical protein